MTPTPTPTPTTTPLFPSVNITKYAQYIQNVNYENYLPGIDLSNTIKVIGTSTDHSSLVEFDEYDPLQTENTLTVMQPGSAYLITSRKVPYSLRLKVLPTATPTRTPTQTPTPTRTPTVTPSVSLTPTVTPTKTIGASPTPTPSVTISPTQTPTPTVTPTKTVTPTVTPSVSPTKTPTMTPTPTVTPTASPTTQFVTIGTAGTNTNNVNLYDAYVAIYGVPAGPRNAEFTVAGNIGSSSTSTAALDTGTWPAGSTIKLIVPAVSDGTNSPANGIVAGAGGSGANYAATGNPGGPAINLNYNLIINNNGVIGGGGGGGGWGRASTSSNFCLNCPPWRYTGSGGAGVSPGNPGSSTTFTPGANGSYIAGGGQSSGCSGGGGSTCSYNGAGGSLGANGGNGYNSGYNANVSTAGGAAGKCINLNGYAVSTLGTGQYLGAIS
jgi:hypothetical protein